VCLSVRDHIFGTARTIFAECFVVHVSYGRGSVLIWRRSDTLRTSGYMGVVICSSAKVAPRRRPDEAQCTRSLGLGYKLCAVIPVAGQWTHEPTFRALKVTS